MVESSIKTHDQKEKPMFPEEHISWNLLAKVWEERPESIEWESQGPEGRTRGLEERLQRIYMIKIHFPPFLPLCIWSLSLALGLIICTADCTVLWKLISTGENHKTVKNPFDLWVTQSKKTQRWVSRNANIVHYPLNSEKRISTCLNKFICGMTLMI